MDSQTLFGSHTTASSIAKEFASFIRNQVILITGVANGGLGGATAKALAAHSPRLLILAGRSAAKVNAVIDDLSLSDPTVACRFLHVDLSSQTSVRAAAALVLAYPEPLHILINNAAVMNLPERTLTTDGLETQFATNYLGPFLLTNLLLPKLLSSVPSSPPNSVRIINLSSVAHQFSPLRFSDLNFSCSNNSLPQDEQFPSETIKNLGMLNTAQSHYIPIVAYGQSKTGNILFTIALNARLSVARGIQSYAVHPGSIDTDLQRHEDPKMLAEARKRFGNKLVTKTLEAGASTTLVAALDPALGFEKENVYMADCAFAEPAEWCKGEKGRERAERLWRVSEDLVGEKFAW